MVPHIWHSMGKHLSRAVRARKGSRLLFLETDENDREGFGVFFQKTIWWKVHPSVWDGSSDSVGLQDGSEPDPQTLCLLTLP